MNLISALEYGKECGCETLGQAMDNVLTRCEPETFAEVILDWDKWATNYEDFRFPAESKIDDVLAWFDARFVEE